MLTEMPHHDLRLLVHHTYCGDPKGHVSLFKQMRRVSAYEIEHEFYEPFAWLPDFSSQRPVQLTVPPPSPPPWHLLIGLYSLPATLQQSAALLIQKVPNLRPISIQKNLDRSPIGGEIKQYLAQTFALLDDDMDDMKFSFSEAGLQTITVDHQRGAKPGVHFDSWDGQTRQARLAARIRFNVNLGPADRWLFFCPISLLSALCVTGQPDSASADIERLCSSFFRNENTPFGSLRLRPGDGYFAATDLIMHDASSYWSEREHFVYQFRARPKNSHPQLDGNTVHCIACSE